MTARGINCLYSLNGESINELNLVRGRDKKTITDAFRLDLL